MKTVIHVNQHKIRSNVKTGRREPVITVKAGRKNTYCHEAVITDKEGNEIVRVRYCPDRPLSCGARVWIETQLSVQVICHD